MTLSVEGNISAGKSTFLSILNRHLLQDEGFSVSVRQYGMGPCTAEGAGASAGAAGHCSGSLRGAGLYLAAGQRF